MKAWHPLIAALALLLSIGASAQSTMDETRPATPDGIVSIKTVCGSVEVLRWEKAEIRVSGTLEKNSGPCEFSVRDGRATIEVKPKPHGWGEKSAYLTIEAPFASDLDVETVSASVIARNRAEEVATAAGNEAQPLEQLDASQPKGAQTKVDVDTVSGSIEVHGPARHVVTQSVSGEIHVDCEADEIGVETVSGDVFVAGSAKTLRCTTTSGDMAFSGSIEDLSASSMSGNITASEVGSAVDVSSYSGDVKVAVSAVDEGEIEVYSGDVEVSAALSVKGRLSVSSLSGDIELRCPQDTSAEFDLETTSGDMDLQLAATGLERSDRTSLRFTMGAGSGRVGLKTVSGDMRIAH